MKDNLWHINHQGGRQASNKSIFGVGPWQQYLKSSLGGSSMHLRLRPVDQDFLRSPGQLGPSGHCARLCLLSSGPSALAPDPAFRCSPISRTFTFTLRTSTLSACSPAVSSTIRPSLRLPLPCTAPRWVAAYLCPEHLRGTALTELLPFSPTGSIKVLADLVSSESSLVLADSWPPSHCGLIWPFLGDACLRGEGGRTLWCLF